MVLSTEIEITQTVPLTLSKDGAIRVTGTRITLDIVVAASKEGMTPEEMAEQYSTLNAADIYLVIGYYLHHQLELDAYILKRQEQAEDIRKKIEAQWPSIGVRERLLARRKQ